MRCTNFIGLEEPQTLPGDPIIVVFVCILVTARDVILVVMVLSRALSLIEISTVGDLSI